MRIYGTGTALRHRPRDPLITHDLHLAPDADRILVLDRGRLVESGRHDELLARGGTYARLYRHETALCTSARLRSGAASQENGMRTQQSSSRRDEAVVARDGVPE
ncbi:hypothetical protein B1H19_24205 [Streptomyces gilvosporeus]|uniref:ABC transporter ATP-binding protein n=1 Tax=Streptomyces gilvosporeus TaxID=553510 RepID=A0A1V0TW29_9ACTN|nr:hypothetical protein B1H19_24205 [Streptomyces gilvosporeus]